MLVYLLACGSKEISEETVVIEAPAIQHSPTEESLLSGDNYGLTVAAQDQDGVYEVVLHYRMKGDPYFDSQPLLETGPGETPQRSVLLSGQVPSLREPGLEYYFSAVDQNGAIALLPAKGPSDPFVVEVFPKTNALPFVEDFSLEDGEYSLLDLNWWTPCDKRDSFSFHHVASEGNENLGAAFHPRGYPNIPELRDWLISPPLDFSDPNGAMIRWSEMFRGDVSLSHHELYISTGKRLPEDGDYELVQMLEVSTDTQSGEWNQTSYIDLSQWAGEDRVYIAWNWQGVEADDWYIDDIEVLPLAPDLEFLMDASGVATSTSSGMVPGGAIQLQLHIQNNTSMGTEGLIVDALLPQGGGQFETSQIQTEQLDGNGSISTSFVLMVDEDTPNYQYLPLEFHVQTIDGTQNWLVEEKVLLGEPSTIQFSLEMPFLGTFDAFVGIGDPEDPIWSTTVYSDPLDEGLHQFQIDITEQQDYLPPIAGEERWYLGVRASVNSDVFDVSLQSHGQNFEGTSIYAKDDLQYIYFPKPPKPVLSSAFSNSGDPGSTIYPAFSFSNPGADFSGMVRGTLLSNSPDITISSSSSFIDEYLWSAGESQYWSGPSISISENHKNNQNIPVDILIEDDIESWLLSFDVLVPWPMLKVLGVFVVDDDNQILDPNESADLEISIANVGGKDAFGFVTGHLELVGNSGSSDVVIDNFSPTFGFLDVGESDESDNFSVTVNGGSIGDILEFSLLTDDGTESYEDQFSIILGETPWLFISPFADDIGDVLEPSAVDFEYVEMRYFNNKLEMRITGANTIDTQSFIEIWGTSNGSSYAFYRWVLQGGVASVQGYDYGFSTIADMEVEFPTSNQVILRWDPSSMGLSQQSLRMGFASGWCGPPEYFCDHFPDDWGYPYVAYTDQDWFSYQWE